MKDWQDELVKMVSQCAPALGNALGGPAGGMVGTIIAAVFGSDKEPSTLVQAIAADPNSDAKLKQIEMDHQQDLQKIALRQSAIDTLKAIVEMD